MVETDDFLKKIIKLFLVLFMVITMDKPFTCMIACDLQKGSGYQLLRIGHPLSRTGTGMLTLSLALSA